MLPFSVIQVAFSRASGEEAPAGMVCPSRSQAATNELPPWPLVVTLPLTSALSLALWVGIGQLLSMVVAG